MYKLKAIKTNKDYEAALAELEKVFDAEYGSPEGDFAEVLVILIQDYERVNFPIEPPDPIDAIKFRMDQMNLKQTDLAKYLGSESRVSEILKGKRPLTVKMIAALHNGLGIPLESLIAAKQKKKRTLRYKTAKRKLSTLNKPKVKYGKKKKA